jgi:hypothetical protein
MASLKANPCGILQWDWIFDFRFTIADFRFIIDLPLWEVSLLVSGPDSHRDNSYHHWLSSNLPVEDSHSCAVTILFSSVPTIKNDLR